MELFAKASDEISDRSIVSPAKFEPAINIQVVRSETGETQVQRTEFQQTRTGIKGFLRPWQITGFASFDFLSPGRGDNDRFLNFPGIDVKYHIKEFNLVPYFNFEKRLLHPGSTLSITNLKTGFMKPFPHPLAYYSLGLEQYSLSGNNKGETRLGDFFAATAGIGGVHCFESWLVGGSPEASLDCFI